MNTKLHSNLYETPGKDPILRQSLVCAADILGWKRSTHEAFKQERQGIFLREVRRVLNVAYDRLREIGEDHLFGGNRDYEIKTYTDNIVIGMPITSNPSDFSEPELGTMLRILEEFQFRMACGGFFLRGALSYGSHYMDKDFVFGDAHIEAVSLDQKGSPPRIVVAPSMEPLIRQHSKKYGGHVKGSPNYSDFLEDSDGKIFIDYLKEAFMAFPDGPIFFEFLDDHKKIIQSRLKQYASEYEIRKKYEWLARYHNFSCQNFLESQYIDPEEEDGETIAYYEQAMGVKKYLFDKVQVGQYPSQLGDRWDFAESKE